MEIFLEVGVNTQDTSGLTFDAYGFGWMIRLNANGNPLWERLDLTPIDTFATFNHWAKVVELESGSIIATGIARTFIDWEWRDWGSIIKVDVSIHFVQ